MELFGRRIVMTMLDEIPRNLRALPGCLALTHVELAAIECKDNETIERIGAIAAAEDRV